MKKILAFVMTVVMVLLMTGCVERAQNEPKTALCLVVANTANSNIDVGSEAVTEMIYETIRGYGYITVINADGKPSVAFSGSFDISDSYKNASAERLNIDAREKASAFTAMLNNIVADDEEVDYLKALQLASRSVASVDAYTTKKVLVIGTGVSTTGTLNLANGLLNADTDTVIKLLKERDEIPNFAAGTTVTWQNLADTSLPQKELTSSNKTKLKELYRAIVEEGNGTIEFDETLPRQKDNETNYPFVTPITFAVEDPIVFEDVVLDTTTFEAITLPEEKISFVADKAIYLHPNEVSQTLKPIADFLIEHGTTVVLAGCVAGDEQNDFALSLSRQRAEAVKTSLIELGVAPAQLLTVGLGCQDPWHVYGLTGELASVNRKVVILDRTCETAQFLLNGGELI